MMMLLSSVAYAYGGVSSTYSSSGGSGSTGGAGVSSTYSGSVTGGGVSGLGVSSSFSGSVSSGSTSTAASSSSSSSSTSTSTTSSSSGGGSSGGSSGGSPVTSGLAAADFNGWVDNNGEVELSMNALAYKLTFTNMNSRTVTIIAGTQTIESEVGKITFMDLDNDGTDDIRLKITEVNVGEEAAVSIEFLRDGGSEVVTEARETSRAEEIAEEVVVETIVDDSKIDLETGKEAVKDLVEDTGKVMSDKTVWVVAVIAVLIMSFLVFGKEFKKMFNKSRGRMR